MKRPFRMKRLRFFNTNFVVALLLVILVFAGIVLIAMPFMDQSLQFFW